MEKNEEKMPYLLFKIKDTTYAVNCKFVEHTSFIDDVTPQPNQSEHIIGVIQYKENVVPVISLRSVFNLPAREEDFNNEKVKMDEVQIIISTEDSMFAIIVDEVLNTEFLNNSADNQIFLSDYIDKLYVRDEMENENESNPFAFAINPLTLSKKIN